MELRDLMCRHGNSLAVVCCEERKSLLLPLEWAQLYRRQEILCESSLDWSGL